MKKIIIALLVVLLVPVMVNAEPVDRLEIEFTEPEVGATPDFSIKIKTTENGAVVVDDEFELVWAYLDEDSQLVVLDENDKFIEKTQYFYEPIVDLENPINLENDPSTGLYINGVRRDNDFLGITSTYRIKTIRLDVVEPVIGEKPTNTAVYNVITEGSNGKTDKFEIPIVWVDLGTYDDMTSEVFEVDKKYGVSADFTSDSEALAEFIETYSTYLLDTTKIYANDVEIGDNMPEYGPLKEQVKITYTYKNLITTGLVATSNIGDAFKTVLKPEKDYLLPESIIVKVNGVELTKDKYSYDCATGEFEIESLTGDLEIIATAELGVTNPSTFDGIGTSMIMGTMSLITLVCASIYLKKKEM